MTDTIKIGTRGSKLALWQAHDIAQKLGSKGLSTEIIIIETKGDKMLNQAFLEIGSKGLFTEELETKLKDGSIDIAVHSAKDLQSELGEGLEIIAYAEREQANDVLVSFNKSFTLEEEKQSIIGTSSTRRKAILRNLYPNIHIVEARGNLQTRFQKMQEGQSDAMILAYAGIHRMNYNDFIVQVLPLDVFTPPAGQGCVAIEASPEKMSPEKLIAIKEAINHQQTALCVKAERSFLKTIDGGCSIPAFIHATIEGERIKLMGGIISLDGKEILRESLSVDINEGEKGGEKVAEHILKAGGNFIIDQIKSGQKK